MARYSARNPCSLALAALLPLAALPLCTSASALADPSPRDREISFTAPIEFATSAAPSSLAFNTAAGDQVALDIALGGGVPGLFDDVAVADFNHDLNLDVAQTNVIAGSVSLFLGDGLGGFAQPLPALPVGVNPISVVAGNLNQDAHPDLVVANSGSNDLAVLLGCGHGVFRPASFVPLTSASEPGMRPRNVVIGKFNGDPFPDLAVAERGSNASRGGGVTVLTGQSDGNFTVQQFIKFPPGANCVAAGDFDRNGRDDLAVGVGVSENAGDRRDDGTFTGDDVLIFLNRNQAPGTIPEQPFNTTPDQPAIRVGATPRAIAVAELNGDHLLDLTVMDSASADVTILIGNDRGHFSSKPAISTMGVSVAVGCFNGDLIPDLVTANFIGSTISVLQGKGDGTFLPAMEYWAGNSPMGVAVGDFNSDQRADIVAGRLRTDQLSLLLNDSPQPGDGLVINRDIYYLRTNRADDPLEAHHRLDVYSPLQGTASFAGEGKPYPVLFFVHGGKGTTGDKNQFSYLVRSLAQVGIVAVSIEYRLNQTRGLTIDQSWDVAHAFRWVYDHVKAYGGDRNNIFVMGHSAGSDLLGIFTTGSAWQAEQQHIRGTVLIGGFSGTPHGSQPPSLLLTGTEGVEPTFSAPNAAAFYTASTREMAESYLYPIPGRDHFTLPAGMAVAGDPARGYLLEFLTTHLGSVGLRVAGTAATDNRSQQGKTTTLTATVANTGKNNAGPSRTEFLLDDGTLLGLVETPAITRGNTTAVTLEWETSGSRVCTLSPPPRPGVTPSGRATRRTPPQPWSAPSRTTSPRTPRSSSPRLTGAATESTTARAAQIGSLVADHQDVGVSRSDHLLGRLQRVL